MRLKDIKKILNYDTTKVAVERKARLKKKKPTVLDNWEFVSEPKKSNYGWYLLGFSILFFIRVTNIYKFYYILCPYIPLYFPTPFDFNLKS